MPLQRTETLKKNKHVNFTQRAKKWNREAPWETSGAKGG